LLSRQLEGIDFDEGDAAREMFDRIFVGEEAPVSLEWKREVGAWWARKRGPFCDGGKMPWEEIQLRVSRILDEVETWEQKGGMHWYPGYYKRKAGFIGLRDAPKGEVFIKRVFVGKEAEKVMSEEWRARRRIQEKKAGRWTDGTARMDRLWNTFHWVLDVDDPRDASWRWIHNVSGADIWGMGSNSQHSKTLKSGGQKPS
jgi:hypothetical protein